MTNSTHKRVVFRDVDKLSRIVGVVTAEEAEKLAAQKEPIDVLVGERPTKARFQGTYQSYIMYEEVADGGTNIEQPSKSEN